MDASERLGKLLYIWAEAVRAGDGETAGECAYAAEIAHQYRDVTERIEAYCAADARIPPIDIDLTLTEA